ncbi:MAG: 50S ribosomal protein L2 [Alphaproteobacteria bacterium]|nr:50S ribosomal protein L2 [Alphaproteobacteria bacterium]
MASALKVFNPTTPSQRGLVLVDRSEISKNKPEKSLTVGFKRGTGRNNAGHITNRNRGCGHKRSYRIIDFKRNKFDVVASVLDIQYDPNRTSYIALIQYTDGEKSYILAPQRLQAGDTVVSGQKVEINPGNAMPLKNVPVGTLVHNVELKPGRGGQIARAAGCYAQLIGKDSGYALLRLRSGEVRMINSECMATIGALSNPDQQNIQIGKAGRQRWLGRRPHVRGVAMNPVDHPHGGGEGKTSGGRHPVSPKGKPTKGKRTRSRKKVSNKHIVRRRYEK